MLAIATVDARQARAEKDASASPDAPMTRPLTYAEFRSRSGFSRAEIIALSRGTLVSDPPGEIALLPSDLMLEIGRIERIAGRLTA